MGHSPCGSVDGNRTFMDGEEQKGVTPHAGVWIEIALAWPNKSESHVTPHAGVWIEILLVLQSCSRIDRHSPCGSVD